MVASSQRASAVRPTRFRISILVLLFLTVLVNYIDRGILAVMAPIMNRDLHLDSVALGWAFSAFGWAYVAGQLPGGWAADRFAARGLYAGLLALWSVLVAAQGLARGFISLWGLRFGMGAAEAPSFLINIKVVTMWFPERERARAIGLYTSGQFVSLAGAAPLLVWLATAVGWRETFVLIGVGGALCGIAWYLVYRDPCDARAANATELNHIAAGGGLLDRPRAERPPVGWKQLRVVLRSRNLWGVFIGHLCTTTTLWFFLTWFPTYLVQYRHLDFRSLGWTASFPFLAAFVGVLAGSQVSDGMLRAGMSLATARKTPVICGLALATCIIGVDYVQSQNVAIALLAVAFFGNGFASIAATFISALAPAGMVGITSGIYNLVGNCAAIFVPIVIGLLVRHGSFAPALYFVGGCSLIGVLSYLFLVRDLGRIVVAS